MTDFERAAAFTLSERVEGGYVSPEAAARVGDTGGETNRGITKRDYPDEDIKELTRERALEIYHRDYWSSEGVQKSLCDRLPWPLNLAHFDCTVNIGNAYRPKGDDWLWTGNANEILQRAAGVPDDGHIGPITLAAILMADPTELALQQIDERIAFYLKLIEISPSKSVFRGGWLNRCELLRQRVLMGERDFRR